MLTQDYLDYVAKLPTEVPDAVSNISYTRGVDINLLVKGESSVQKFNTTAYTGNIRETITGANNKYWSEMPDNKDFIGKKILKVIPNNILHKKCGWPIQCNTSGKL
ncbi:hypothetical protein ERICIV_02516 [Paenibacillus larvae subsp. larvae]|uniref:Uncharacterized protein n=1 Tax=Paenibacillus larvae subsp. larvae TaxID=147375 RepID=A0A2L1U166_9BACL|nr:hypothetical protein [Paenibacillus larvae]AVF26673.1 hypothetical protein ERICIII_02527 [Paenibacillus larvae subsp. larvae]AQT83498.1 hypothetical protein B1222_02105 [Paenibacillus larvae subsp. pulvifaciens]AQZ48602.1 hypothetical protein B5S25_20530 [Paenibacillus larvae subsp. pulvifaciens]AVF31420.1 hypothetical protein ERICIV_02516 [Paenibacillus larvae subsp. larvae]MCY9503081.1 hypothetical protein [Paenibacillus larvae]